MAVFARAWGALDAVGQQASRIISEKAGPTVGHAPVALSACCQETGKAVGGAAVQTSEWVKKHRGQTAGIVGCVIATPVAIAVTSLVLGAAGFGAAGIVAGELSTIAEATCY